MPKPKHAFQVGQNVEVDNGTETPNVMKIQEIIEPKNETEVLKLKGNLGTYDASLCQITTRPETIPS